MKHCFLNPFRSQLLGLFFSINSLIIFLFPVTVLDECFRQEGNSTISQNAIKINKNQLDLVFDDTFQFIPASTPEEASRKIQKIYRKEVLQRNGSLEEVQVMSPLRKDTEAGTDALNLVLRDIANPKRFGYPEITNGRNTYREGDRVMQTKNNDEVANGDIGEVIGIFRKDQDRKSTRLNSSH